jgi:hypothetical protein
MAERVHYQAPRRINSFSVTLALMALALGYWAWRFFPVHFDSWTVDHILKESASQCYRANRLREPERTTTLTDIVNKAKADIRRQTGITDPELVVNLNIEETTASMSAEYQVIVTHPLVSKTTTLHFQRKENADIKVVNWDNQ